MSDLLSLEADLKAEFPDVDWKYLGDIYIGGEWERLGWSGTSGECKFTAVWFDGEGWDVCIEMHGLSESTDDLDDAREDLVREMRGTISIYQDMINTLTKDP